MKTAVPLALLLLLLPAAPSGAAPVSGFDATAAGTVSLRVLDPWTGAVFCESQAVVALEAGSTVGAFAWDSPDCGEDGTGVALFTIQCSDACFPACHLPTFWSPDEVTCFRDAVLLDEAWSDGLTLARDGALSFSRDVWTAGTPYRIEARGVLLVASWPSA